MKTRHDVIVHKFGGGPGYPVTVPAGTWLEVTKDGQGRPLFAVANPSVCRTAYAALFKHDSKYRYVFVPADAVEFENNWERYKVGSYECTVPPGYTGNWTEGDWVKWIDKNGKWL